MRDVLGRARRVAPNLHSAPPCGTEPPEGYGGWRWLKAPPGIEALLSAGCCERPLQGDWPWLMNYRSHAAVFKNESCEFNPLCDG
jgi:hypothetical protein